MRNIVAAINMTVDGYCDHTGLLPDEEIHNHYATLIQQADGILYGRITYELMKFWRDLAKSPSGEPSMDAFAKVMNDIPKRVFSRTQPSLDWESTTLATGNLIEEVEALRHQSGKDILVGSRSLIMQLLKHQLIDELQLCIHPILAGSGLSLFDEQSDRTLLTLTATKQYKSGAMVLYYQPLRPR